MSKKTTEEDVLQQVDAEVRSSKDTFDPKKVDWRDNLRLYINSKRDKDKVGDDLLYTLMNTMLANLWFDNLQVSFSPRESGDVNRCELYNNLAVYDSELMGKAKKEYEIDFDSLFFGEGYYAIEGINKKLLVPEIRVVDPFTVIRDPNNDWEHQRFFYEERKMTKDEMTTLGFHNLDKLSSQSEDDSETKKAEQERKDAMNEADQSEPATYGNKEYVILAGYTKRNGNWIRIFTDYNRQVIFKIEDNPFTDGIPYVQRMFSPIPHQVTGVSIPDLASDKQRARAIMVNLAIMMEKSKLLPMYLIDRGAMIDMNSVKKFEFNKFIPADLKNFPNPIQPIQKVDVDQNLYNIHDLITGYTERAIGANAIKQGVTDSTRRTAAELKLVDSASDVRQSLAARLFADSDKDFWRKWLNRNVQFKSLLKGKIVRIQGALGVKFEELDDDTFRFESYPDVIIESTEVSSARSRIENSALTQMAPLILGKDTPNSAKNFMYTKLLKNYGFKKDDIDQILPPSFDELRARDENNLLNAGKLPKIEAYDDHYVHIAIHNQAKDNPEKIAHMQEHMKAIMEKREAELTAQATHQPNVPGATPNSMPTTTEPPVPTSPDMQGQPTESAPPQMDTQALIQQLTGGQGSDGTTQPVV